MHLIKECPSCRNRIRFPIDRGTIKVTCKCGRSFTADPDNRELYKNATIDARPAPGRERASALLNSLKGTDLSKLKVRLINSILEFKYSLQNFRLLPNGERAVILLKLAAAAAPLILLIYIIWRFLAASPGAGGVVL